MESVFEKFDFFFPHITAIVRKKMNGRQASSGMAVYICLLIAESKREVYEIVSEREQLHVYWKNP